MRIEIYERKDHSEGIYIAGDLSGALPEFIRYRDRTGKEWNLKVHTAEVQRALDALHAALTIDEGFGQ